MDARDALIRYLEQRRDLGEQELVLDSMTVEEAMRLLGAANLSSGVGAGRRPMSDDAAPSARVTAPAAKSDWRATLRAAGAEGESVRPTVVRAPDAAPPREPAPARTPRLELHPPGESAPPAEIDLSAVPAGITVGGQAPPSGDPAASANSLEEIAELVRVCRRCPLFESAINPVPGAGNPDADLMVVGEAPGQSEDEQGVPFVGASGALLTKILGAIGLARADVFIANVLKHRPPGNRNPTAEEVRVCSPYLLRQIELVQPKVILALGTFAAQTLLETKTSIGKLRGQIHRYHGVPLIVTYHPAALLRNPSWKRPTWEDVQLARRILDQ